MSQSPAALERWFLTAHERASVTTALREMYGDDENLQVGAILWRINMLYPIMALIVDLDCDLVGIDGQDIRIKSLRYHWCHRAKSNLKPDKRM